MTDNAPTARYGCRPARIQPGDYELPARIPLTQAGRIKPEAVVSHRFPSPKARQRTNCSTAAPPGRKILLDHTR
ncbi:hypothetical protein [Streptomyces sp. NBC_00203]|uniref:hypothetical protein n=1 Tax=Streptomyces sp. NBC_00203 TaxID=2975680 RepID=UPI003251C69D